MSGDIVERLAEYRRLNFSQTCSPTGNALLGDAIAFIKSLRSDNAAMREALEAISVDDCMDPWGLARTTLSRIQERDNG